MRKAPRCGDWNPPVNSCLTDAAGRSPGHWQESWCNWNVWSSGCWCSTATPSFANSTLPWSRKEKTAALPPWKTLRVSHFPFLRLPRLTNPKYQKSVKDVWRRCVKDVPRLYSYSTAAWGKWHNTPAEETTAAGPFENWPTGLGFEYFYGFLAGEASQYEPKLVRNTTVVLPPKSPEEGYHLSEDLADDAMKWLDTHKALQADKPFYMYWARGAIHGPHHIMKEWADKYKGKFDDGWDAYRERVFKRAKEKGWIPQ